MPLSVHGLANKAQGLAMLQHVSATGEPVPFPNHADTMFLDGLRPKDVPVGKVLVPKEDSSSLRTWDIDKAAPAYQLQTLFLEGAREKEPIPGAQAKTSYPPLRRPISLSLTTADIEGAQSSARGFRTNRSLDPLTPRYVLPSFKEKPVTPPGVWMHEGQPWETSSLALKDEPLRRFLERDYARHPLEVRDIEGALPNSSGRLSSFTPRDMRSKIIESAGGRILHAKNSYTPRENNPMNPVYAVPVQTTHPLRAGEGASRLAPREVGHIHGATPRVLHKDNGEPQLSLIRADIPGALPQRYKGAMPFSIYDPPHVTPHTRFDGLDCSDIEGAQTGTRIR